MSTAAVAGITVEDAIGLFGRLSDSQHVFSKPIRTAASGFEFSSNTAIKPKWLIAYVSREPSGEDVDLPTHTTRWSSLLFADGAGTISRGHFDEVLGSAEFAAPLGVPKWSIPGKALVDLKACAAKPSDAALDALWTAFGGAGETLEREVMLACLLEWPKSDELGEAILFSEFAAGIVC